MQTTNTSPFAVQSRVERILDGTQTIKNTDSYTNYTFEELTELQSAFDKRKHLSAPQAGIWLGKSMSTIYRLITKGKIAVMQAGANSDYVVDVEATKKILAGIN